MTTLFTVERDRERPGEEERLARAALLRVAEPDDVVVGALVDMVGATRAWELVREQDGSLPERLRARTGVRLRDVRPADDLERAASVGARLVCPGDEEWPGGVDELDGLHAGVLALWVRGSAGLADVVARSVAVVGSRASTEYGRHVADAVSAGLADSGWSTVSGGAVGVDAAAHRASLASGAPTVAVLACGVDVAYPPANSGLLRQVAETGGLVVSEWPPGCAPRRHRFLVRNRVLAALARGTVVVEAALRSGALSTARWSQRLGRPTMAVPGPVTSAMSGGCHVLLRETDAVLVTGPAEVLDVVGRIGGDLAPRPSGPVLDRDALPPDAQRVLEATPVRAYVSPDRIAATAGVPGVRATALLNQLHAAGYVEASDAGFRLSAALRRAAG